MAKLYFITGKGGTGKSTLSRTLAESLAAQNKKVLIIKIDSFSLGSSGDGVAQVIHDNLWEQKLQLHEVVEEYFLSTLLKLPIPGILQKVANRIQEEIANKLLANKFVMRFIEACPGLTPTIFLGKICSEAKTGAPLNEAHHWDAVVVDAPSTGQALQIFESSRTFSRVLTQGLIYRHIIDTLGFVYSSEFEVHLMTLPEEGPLQECMETLAKFEKLELKVAKIWINKVISQDEITKLKTFKSNDAKVNEVVQVELDRIVDQSEHIRAFKEKISQIPLVEIPEHLRGEKLAMGAPLE